MKSYLWYVFISLSFCTCEIINWSTVDNLAIPMGNYTQFRVAGYGYGDDTLEDDLAKVKITLDIVGDVAANKISPFNTKWTFDVMLFTNTRDYLCYIEAVALMYEENILKHCDFVDDPNVIQTNQY